MSDDAAFEARNGEKIAAMAADAELAALARAWFDRAFEHEYSYHFRWLGLPMIQFPTDIVALQEIVWRTRPDLIVETGVARGGSLVFFASLLELLGKGDVVGVELDLRPENRAAIFAHPLAKRIAVVDGSSVDPAVAARVRDIAARHERTMVVLDSNHTHEHVLAELNLYAPLVSPGSYLVVFDTVVERMPADAFPERPWGRGNNPQTAVNAFLQGADRFVVDRELEAKLSVTSAPGGWLRCVKEAR
ncbi:MAG: cephalosporin hydroxylase [Myxococcales bacterium]|nr:MAG: cephalosporin hydroxylase [Myxococcales bacterium]